MAERNFVCAERALSLLAKEKGWQVDAAVGRRKLTIQRVGTYAGWGAGFLTLLGLLALFWLGGLRCLVLHREVMWLAFWCGLAVIPPMFFTSPAAGGWVGAMAGGLVVLFHAGMSAREGQGPQRRRLVRFWLLVALGGGLTMAGLGCDPERWLGGTVLDEALCGASSPRAKSPYSHLPWGAPQPSTLNRPAEPLCCR